MWRPRAGLLVTLVAACNGHRPQPPPDDMVTIHAQTFVGDDTACAAGTLSPRPSLQTNRVKLDVPTFQIDRRVVTCEEFERCVSAGACTHAHDVMRCSEGLAAAQRPAALAYCGWRHAELPSWNEWQLAIRGPDAWDYPTGQEHRPEFDREADDPGGIRIKSPLGVEYRWNAPAWLANELTRDDDCWNPEPLRPDWPLIVGPISGFTGGSLHESLDKLGTERSIFRCVRDDATFEGSGR